MTDINEKFVIYYAVRGYRTGQTVAINIYDTVGTKEVDSGTMTELESLGIYYYNFRPKKRTTYLAVMDCSVYARQQHETIRVKKTKLAGAVRIPKVKMPEPSWKKEEKKKLFASIQNLSAKNYQKDFTNLSSNFKKNAEKLASISRQLEELKKRKEEKLNIDFKSLDNVESSIKKETDNFQKTISVFPQLIDDMNINFKLFMESLNDFSNVQFKNFILNLGEVSTLLKNVRSSIPDYGSSKEQESLPICDTGTPER